MALADILTTADVRRMHGNAWREACRSWTEYRAALRDPAMDAHTVSILYRAAWSADDYARHLADVLRARA